MKEKIRTYYDVLVLSLISVPVGAAVSVTDVIFGQGLRHITSFRMDHAFWLIPFLGVIGVVIVWYYQKIGGKCVKGINLIFEAGHGMTDDIPLRLIPLSIVSTWLTHLFGGSAGREGVAVQIGGTLGYGVGKRIPIKNSGKILLIAGMAAGFSGLFLTPIAATFFAIEVLTAGTLEYGAILPAIIASYTAYYLSGALGLERFTFALTDKLPFTFPTVGTLVLLGLIFGIAGCIFAMTLNWLRSGFAKVIPNPYYRILFVGAGISLFTLLCWGGRYSGSGEQLISQSFSGNVFPWDFVLKFIFTMLTLSIGFQGGELMPLFTIGATLGAVLGHLLGLPVALTAALGYAAVFCSATNTLLSPILIGTEVFGFTYLPYFFIVCTVAYACNGNYSIYSLQKGRDKYKHISIKISTT